jgi:hypothetical protein
LGFWVVGRGLGFGVERERERERRGKERPGQDTGRAQGRRPTRPRPPAPLGCRSTCFYVWVLGFGIGFLGFRFWVLGLDFWVLGFGVSGFEF